MEHLQARHRKEQRDLQSRVTQKKKQATKKTRKAVNEECDRLEAQLKEKQQTELAADDGEPVDDTELPEHQLEALTLTVDCRDPPSNKLQSQESRVEAAKDAIHTNGGSSPQEQVKKPNRQKARLARRAAEQEEEARLAAEEAKNMPDMKQQERDRMLEAMQARGLREKEIRADGHCLFSAVADQLEQLSIETGSVTADKPQEKYRLVRAAAADYIQTHPDDFMPFLEEPLPEFLHKVRDTGEWGGQLELIALAKTYATDINVLQDFGRVEKINSSTESSEKAMWLGYYKHGFGLGEHYNSLRKIP